MKKSSGVSRSALSARYMPGWGASSCSRAQGISTCLGVVSEITPTAPASPRSFARSERLLAFSGPGRSAGPPESTTAILPFRSTPLKSSQPCSGRCRP